MSTTNPANYAEDRCDASREPPPQLPILPRAAAESVRSTQPAACFLHSPPVQFRNSPQFPGNCPLHPRRFVVRFHSGSARRPESSKCRVHPQFLAFCWPSRCTQQRLPDVCARWLRPVAVITCTQKWVRHPESPPDPSSFGRRRAIRPSLSITGDSGCWLIRNFIPPPTLLARPPGKGGNNPAQAGNASSRKRHGCHCRDQCHRFRQPPTPCWLAVCTARRTPTQTLRCGCCNHYQHGLPPVDRSIIPRKFRPWSAKPPTPPTPAGTPCHRARISQQP